MSTGLPYASFRRTSGDRYPGVPANPAKGEETVKCLEKLASALCQPLTLTKPCLLVSLHLNGQAEVCQFHCSPFAFTGQKQVLRLQGDRQTAIRTVFTPRAVVRDGRQNRDGSSLLDGEAQPASQHGGPWAQLSPRAIFYSSSPLWGQGEQAQSFKGKLALSLNLDIPHPKTENKTCSSPPQTTTQFLLLGCRAAPLIEGLSCLSSF